jgi:hypothetical protein
MIYEIKLSVAYGEPLQLRESVSRNGAAIGDRVSVRLAADGLCTVLGSRPLENAREGFKAQLLVRSELEHPESWDWHTLMRLPDGDTVYVCEVTIVERTVIYTAAPEERAA